MSEIVYDFGGLTVYRLACRRCNCFLLRSADGDVLVDTSLRLERRVLVKDLRELGVEHLKALILTHSHSDHAASAAFIARRYACPVFIHPAGVGLVRAGTCRVSKGRVLLAKFIVLLIRSGLIKRWEKYEPCPVAEALPGSFAGPRGLEILESPGHSADSLSLLLNGEMALVGDVLIHSRKFGLYPAFLDDKATLMSSWRKLLDSGCESFWPAHGKVITRGELEKALAELS